MPLSRGAGRPAPDPAGRRRPAVHTSTTGCSRCGFLLALQPVFARRPQDLPPPLASRFTAGVAALKAGSLDEAEAAFRSVLRDGGERAFVHHNLGIVLQQRGQHAAAIAEFHAPASLDPAFGPPRLLAGTSLIALGRPADAWSMLEQAVRLMPRESAATCSSRTPASGRAAPRA